MPARCTASTAAVLYCIQITSHCIIWWTPIASLNLLSACMHGIKTPLPSTILVPLGVKGSAGETHQFIPKLVQMAVGWREGKRVVTVPKEPLPVELTYQISLLPAETCHCWPRQIHGRLCMQQNTNGTACASIAHKQIAEWHMYTYNCVDAVFSKLNRWT